jgi:hypothetical protein
MDYPGVVDRVKPPGSEIVRPELNSVHKDEQEVIGDRNPHSEHT